ncbi:hypothetical protein BKA64DRAFT_692065 [Cadophora sp. MPI-SDFR-AT-0126]|nr:hypothetical protein BKA64DRAFT_692065 [Leotiomycetes sp. MPI-SDFR-AT-0126]
MATSTKINGGLSDGNFEVKPPAPVKFSDLPGLLPTSRVPAGTDLEKVASAQLPQLLSLSDSLALTGSYRTFYSAKKVVSAWQETFNNQIPEDLTLVPNTARAVNVPDVSSWINADFMFKVSAHGPEHNNGQWKIWMLRTALQGLAGYENVDVLDPVVSHETAPYEATKEYGELVKRHKHETAQHFDVIVVGCGQAGLGVGGRLQALNVSYLVIDRFGAIGDSWNTRYDSTKLHTVREFGHLPFYRTYDSSYPEFLTKGDIAKGHQDYVKRFGISTELVSSSWSTEENLWTCKLIRDGEHVTFTSVHLVFACGSSGRSPVMPALPNREQFRGKVLHSSDYHNSSEWKGSREVVVGSANTAHDVADDMLRAGLKSVTMIQRGRTWVLPAEHYMMVVKTSYNATIPTEKPDLESMSLPLPIRRQIAGNYVHTLARNDSERFDALEKAGFNVERYGDITSVIFERLGGHYMDVGTSSKISEGLIKVKSGSPPKSYTPDGLLLEDGTEVKADVIIFTTGFVQNMRSIAGLIVGPEVESQLEVFWGLNEEGELKGAFKHTGHPGVWFTGGDIALARYYSQFIALQIKAHLMGAPLEVYKE